MGRIAVGTGAVLLLSSMVPGPGEAQLPGMVPLEVRLPKPPQPVRAEGRDHLIYELRITNVARRGAAIRQVEVIGDGLVLATRAGDSLRVAMARVGETGDGRILGGGRQAVLFLHLSVPAGSAPARLTHRLSVTHADSLEQGSTTDLLATAVAVEQAAVPVLASPLRGGPWVAVNGPGNSSGHRRTVIPLDGLPRIPQRFATDWIRLGPGGSAWQGDSTRNENWFGYGEPLLAVARGKVVAVKDSIIENVPFAPTMAVPITLETVGGNHVILDLGGGRFAFYAHLIPGSIRVRVGEMVRPGQEVGRLGNSGNSTAPHLHFHLGDAPSPLATEGIAFVIASYQDLGLAPEFPGSWSARGPPTERREELPLENRVTAFRK
ncbi:MAG: M23 family metallopeptidase [Gemmatimonadetes bacterium]|nr:M23 family metallopeptidase [Gemmatimonadota bacterium]